MSERGMQISPEVGYRIANLIKKDVYSQRVTDTQFSRKVRKNRPHPFSLRLDTTDEEHRTFLIGWEREQDWYPFEDVLYLEDGTALTFPAAETVVLSNNAADYTELPNGLWKCELFYLITSSAGVFSATVEQLNTMPSTLSGGSGQYVPIATVVAYRDTSNDFHVAHFYPHLRDYKSTAGGNAGGGGIPAKVTGGGPGRSVTGDLYANGIEESPTEEDVTIILYEMNSEHYFRGYLTVTAIGDHYEGGVEVWQ